MSVIPNGTSRKMPSKLAIKKHWEDRLLDIGKFDSSDELYEADYCWGCGMEEKLERCHIVARVLGGSDDVNNLHLLCKDCHKASEFLDVGQYFDWLERRNLMGRIFENVPGETIVEFMKNLSKEKSHE